MKAKAEIILPDDDPDAPIWGAAEIAIAICRPLRPTFHLLERGHLDATKKGGRWVSTRRRLCASLEGGGNARH